MKKSICFLSILCFAMCAMSLHAMEEVDADVELIKLITNEEMFVSNADGKGKAKEGAVIKKFEEVLRLGPSSDVVRVAIDAMTQKKVTPMGFRPFLQSEGYSENFSRKTVEACFDKVDVGPDKIETINIICGLLESYQTALRQ